jgi:hypothetical protein
VSKGLAVGRAALRAAPWRSKDINLTTYDWLHESRAVDEFRVNLILMRADQGAVRGDRTKTNDVISDRGGIPIDVFWQTGKLPDGMWIPDQGVAPYRAR